MAKPFMRNPDSVLTAYSYSYRNGIDNPTLLRDDIKLRISEVDAIINYYLKKIADLEVKLGHARYGIDKPENWRHKLDIE